MNPFPKPPGFFIKANKTAQAPDYSGDLSVEALDKSGGDRGLKLNLSPKKALRVLTSLVCILTALSLITQLSHNLLGVPLIESFVLDEEYNIPTLYSGLALTACSFLLGLIAISKSSDRDRFTRAWYGLSLIFLLLSLDEIMSFHERISDRTRAALNVDGFLYFAWVIPGFALVGMLAIAYFQFWRSLPSPIRSLFLFSAIVFLAGALGINMIGAYWVSSLGSMEEIPYILISTAEEFLEKMGIVFFIYTLLLYIKTNIGMIKVQFET